MQNTNEQKLSVNSESVYEHNQTKNKREEDDDCSSHCHVLHMNQTQTSPAVQVSRPHLVTVRTAWTCSIQRSTSRHRRGQRCTDYTPSLSTAQL